MPAKFLDIMGERFGRLVAYMRGHRVGHKTMWWCHCDCGKRCTVALGSLRSGKTRSCGCYHVEKTIERSKRHGRIGTTEYRIWQSMKKRVLNQNSTSYSYYGGRGITICKRWLKFENFFADMGRRPKGKTLDRIDNDKGYSKRNCRWATWKQQMNNRRVSK